MSIFTRAEKIFELSYHLGKVLETVPDKKIVVDANADGNIDYYTTVIICAQDYYPFGMQMPGRKYSVANSAYRYGFNGKENDKDAGEGIQDYGFRIYSERLGKFLSVDPLTKKYPELTPYQFASNTPIWAIDLDGLEAAMPFMYNSTHAKIGQGIASGIANSVKKTWHFITSDAWKVSTWENTGKFIEQGALSMSTVPITQTPMVDAKVEDFMGNVVNGDAYSRSSYFSELSTDIFTGYIGSEGLGSLKSFALNTVKTEWAIAKQSISVRAIAGAAKAKNGAALYRIGTKGKSAQGAAAQFWSLENPLLDPEGYAKKYNVPLENIKNADFIETANLKKQANFITREAGTAPGSPNTGKGIEVVVDKGGTTNNVITEIKK